MGNLPPSRLLFHPRGLKSVCLDDEGIKQRAIFYAMACLENHCSGDIEKWPP